MISLWKLLLNTTLRTYNILRLSNISKFLTSLVHTRWFKTQEASFAKLLSSDEIKVKNFSMSFVCFKIKNTLDFIRHKLVVIQQI